MAIDPNDHKEIMMEVAINIGCAAKTCVPNLKVTSTVFKEPYILGSTKSMIIEYKVVNLAEIAFQAQLKISFPESLSLVKIPPTCHLQVNLDLLCNINGGSPLYNNSSADFKLTLNTTKLHGKELNIKANVFSRDESNEMDNTVNTIITLAEFSEIEISG